MTHVLASPLPVAGIRPARSGIPVLFHALAALCVLSLLIVSQNAAPAESREVSAEARAVFEQTKEKLLQIRVLHKATGAQASMGSGFLASADGLVLTNYHVVSDVALEPKIYELEFQRSDGTTGRPRLLAVDVANDLAVLSTDLRGQPFLRASGRLNRRPDQVSYQRYDNFVLEEEFGEPRAALSLTAPPRTRLPSPPRAGTITALVRRLSGFPS